MQTVSHVLWIQVPTKWTKLSHQVDKESINSCAVNLISCVHGCRFAGMRIMLSTASNSTASFDCRRSPLAKLNSL